MILVYTFISSVLPYQFRTANGSFGFWSYHDSTSFFPALQDNPHERLTKKELADRIANSLAGREQLLKLLSMNNYDMEANSRQELLTAFKQSYGRSMHLMCILLEKFCPDMSVTDIQNFLYTFFPFMFGIYPYTAVTEKQKTAMKEAGINYVYQTVYELTYSCLIRLLGS